MWEKCVLRKVPSMVMCSAGSSRKAWGGQLGVEKREAGSKGSRPGARTPVEAYTFLPLYLRVINEANKSLNKMCSSA